MKAIRYGIIFVLIISPYLLINYIELRSLHHQSINEVHYKNVLDKATSSATTSLLLDLDLDEKGQAEINKEKAVESFFDVLSLNFNIIDAYERENLKNNVPMIIIIDYDGIVTYCPYQYRNKLGQTQVDHIFHEKVYFSEVINNQVISYKLNDTYKVYDKDKNIVLSGSYDELKERNISELFKFSEDELIKRRQSIITSAIEQELLRINDINEYSGIGDNGYAFYIPDISGDLYTNSIKGPGLMAIIQGMPMGNSSFNSVALSGTSIKKQIPVEGYFHDGKYVYYEGDYANKKGIYVRTFKDKRSAAKEGFYPFKD